MDDAGIKELLARQIAYYRERAPSYDDWWFRRGAYDRGEEFARTWAAEVAAMHSILRQPGPGGRRARDRRWDRHLDRGAGSPR